MTEKIRKVLSFPSPVPAKADYQRVKSSYSLREIKQMFGLSERTVRRWTETGIIQGTPVVASADFTYDFQALTLFRRVREMRAQGLTIKQIEAWRARKFHAVAETRSAPRRSALQSGKSLLRRRRLSTCALALRSRRPNRAQLLARLLQSRPGLSPLEQCARSHTISQQVQRAGTQR